MTLNTTDYLEYYLTLVGWIVSNGIWNILVASGVFALPFVVMVVQEWLRARAEGADEGNKGVLSSMRIENRVWVAIVVILFAGIPFIPVDLSTIKFDTTRSAQCQVSVPQPTDTGWSNAYTTLNNQSALVPVWWFFMHAISKAVTGGAVAAIPCGTDLRQMRMDVDATRINDPVLAQEVGDFVHDCYGPSRAKLFMSRPTLSDEQMNDVTWIGSSYFLNNAGFYDTYHSNTPRTAWPYDATRDAGLAQVDSGGGYPTCRQWWSDGGSGLRARLLAQVDPDLLTRIGRWAGFLSQGEVNDSVIRAVVSPRQQKMNQGSVYTDYGGQIEKTLPNVVTRGAGDLQPCHPDIPDDEQHEQQDHDRREQHRELRRDDTRVPTVCDRRPWRPAHPTARAFWTRPRSSPRTSPEVRITRSRPANPTAAIRTTAYSAVARPASRPCTTVRAHRALARAASRTSRAVP